MITANSCFSLKIAGVIERTNIEISDTRSMLIINIFLINKETIVKVGNETAIGIYIYLGDDTGSYCIITAFFAHFINN